ncbi:MAG: site-specific integrase [Paracoccaceae bacterium]
MENLHNAGLAKWADRASLSQAEPMRSPLVFRDQARPTKQQMGKENRPNRVTLGRISMKDIAMSKPKPACSIPPNAETRVRDCPYADDAAIAALRFRDAPYFYTLLVGRHIGIHRPDNRTCNWTARLMTEDKRYIQRCLGPALNLGRGQVDYPQALKRAFAWFDSPEIKSIAHQTRPTERTRTINICPIGDVYTVGHALKDYTEWTKIARSPGGHYNNLILMNYHLVPNFSHVPLEEFTAGHLKALAQQVLETSPRFGFMKRQMVAKTELSVDELRRRKRTFNSLVSIMSMAFQHAWDNGCIESERPWRCLKRILVAHSPRTIFLTRPECRRLLAACTPELKKLVLAGLYTGCRVGELGSLRVEDVAREGFGIRVGAFKRGPARFVFLPDEGMAFFLSLCEGKSPRDHLLQSEKGKVWKKQHTALFRRAVAFAGLPSNFVFHGLRHTYASDLVAAGVTLDIVAKQLGHANTITVSNTYGHLAEHYREEQIRNRFSPLSRRLCREAKERRSELEALLQAANAEDWRSYAQLPMTSSHPHRSYLRTQKSVLEVFRSVERR